MRTLKKFKIEWDDICKLLYISIPGISILSDVVHVCYTEQEAYQWLEKNGYITYEKSDNLV